ncbi:hypothetical protein evm_005277 [Chilo suppressalis]|nr:hypothetical protein evm_005277 [Chilo suppressalis]
MEKELDPVVIKATQTTLGKYVKRPPLSEKLLKKPPFRFLHDIVTNVLKTTGFFEGLFEEEELISENVKDRESKILFLNKVIAVVGSTTGRALSVKSSKIVAGQEPEKTNELLQYLAQALDKKLSSKDAVQKYKESVSISTKSEDKKSKEPSRTQKKTSDSNKLTSRSNEKLTTKKEPSTRTSNRNDEKINVNKSKSKEKSNNMTQSPPKKTTKSVSKKPSIEKIIHENKSNSELPNTTENELKSNSSSEITIVAKQDEINENPSLNLNHKALTESKGHNLDMSYSAVDNLNSSLPSQDLVENENSKTNEDFVNSNTNVKSEVENIEFQNEKTNENISYDINIHGSKNSTLADTVTDNQVESTDEVLTKTNTQENIAPVKVKNIVRPLSVRPSSSRPGAPRLRDKYDNISSETENILVGKVNIIVENAANEDEEDTSIMIVDQELDSSQTGQDEQEQMQASFNHHGHLVQQILNSQKEYSQLSGKTEIEWEFGAQRARDAVNKEIEQLRFNIQGLSRVANPLGKLLDHIQEDVEVMRQELQQWTKTYEEASKELSKQKAANEDSLFPLTTKVKQLDADIVEKHDKINDLKVVIHKNSTRIEKLLANGNVQ